MRSTARPSAWLALLGGGCLPYPRSAGPAGRRPQARAPCNQPALKQAPAPQTRSAQGDCVREANRRGFTVLDTSNFQQFRDGWSIDLRVRNQRGQVTNGSCFVETRTGDVNLYGFGWGYDDDGDDRMQFNCASVDMKYRECQLPVQRPRRAGQAALRCALRRRPELGPARRSRLGRPRLPRQVRGHRAAWQVVAAAAARTWSTATRTAVATANARSARDTSAGWCATTATAAAGEFHLGHAQRRDLGDRMAAAGVSRRCAAMAADPVARAARPGRAGLRERSAAPRRTRRAAERCRPACPAVTACSCGCACRRATRVR